MLLAVFTADPTADSQEYRALEDTVALDTVALDKALLIILHFLLRLTMVISVVTLAISSTPACPTIIGIASTTLLLEAAIRMDLELSQVRMALTL